MKIYTLTNMHNESSVIMNTPCAQSLTQVAILHSQVHKVADADAHLSLPTH